MRKDDTKPLPEETLKAALAFDVALLKLPGRQPTEKVQ
jgi:hypothetical protein